MDIEKTMEFIVAQQANAEVQMAAMRAQLAGMREQMERNDARSKEEMAAIRTILQETAVIQHAQARIQEGLEKTTKELAESQKITEQKLQGLIDALRRGGNGNPKIQ